MHTPKSDKNCSIFQWQTKLKQMRIYMTKIAWKSLQICFPQAWLTMDVEFGWWHFLSFENIWQRPVGVPKEANFTFNEIEIKNEMWISYTMTSWRLCLQQMPLRPNVVFHTPINAAFHTSYIYIIHGQTHGPTHHTRSRSLSRTLPVAPFRMHRVDPWPVLYTADQLLCTKKSLLQQICSEFCLCRFGATLFSDWVMAE